MPLNVRLSAGELAAILRHSGARMLLYEIEFAPVVEQLREVCPGVEYWVSLDGKYEEILTLGSAQRADIFSYDENSIAELFYTSGSTGVPKGVALAARTIYLHALEVAICYRDAATMVELHTIPLFHANGWGRPQVSTMLGVKQVMVRRFECSAVLPLID